MTDHPPPSLDRENVLDDFRKIAGPLRGRNQGQKAKQEAPAQDPLKKPPARSES